MVSVARRKQTLLSLQQTEDRAEIGGGQNQLFHQWISIHKGGQNYFCDTDKDTRTVVREESPPQYVVG